MAREVLSLKSIYKFLTLNDYPVYSEGIIKKDNRAGLTLNKFYLENILIEFKNGKTGKILWRTEGSRNRYLSEICNRSERLSIYKEYADEVEQAADYDTVLRQIKQYMSFLLERQYNVDNFSKKIPAMIEMYEAGDEAFSQEALEFFEQAMLERKTIEGQGLMVDAFCCSWILTMFTIHALMGNGEGEENLHRIRSDKHYSLLEMLKCYQEKQEASPKYEIKGVDNYRLRPIGKDAASRIFRDNYDSYLDEDERHALEEILENEFWCRAFTLQFLAKYVKKKGCTLQELKRQLEAEEIPTEYSEEEQYALLQRIYQKYV